jgi:LysR family hydrogen peroxide-inducible transcriptional activator
MTTTSFGLTLRQLQYFVAVGEHRSFRRAADHLGVTQPTLTAQVAALEQALEVQLFERSRAGTMLTAAGRDLLPSARRVLEEAQGFTDVAASFAGGQVGTYRLGVTPTLGPYLLPYVLPAIHEEYAGLKLYVREGTPSVLESDVKNGAHDFILTTLPVLARELVVDPLFREPLRLAISRDHHLAAKPQITPQDLKGEEVLVMGEPHLFHRQIVALCERFKAIVRRDYEGTSLDTLRQMAVMGMGLTFLPALYVKSEIRESDNIRITDIEGAKMFRNHALVWRFNSPGRNLFRELAERLRSLAVGRLGDATLPIGSRRT